MGQIRDDIKQKNFKNIYLLYGEEAFLRIYNKKALRDALVSPDDSLNYSYFEGTSTQVGEVVDLVNTMPFMSDHRLVLCENTGWLAGESGLSDDKFKMLTDSLTNIGEDVVFAMCEEKVDKRSKLFKFLTKNGSSEEFAKESEGTLKRWVAGYLGNSGKKITAAAAEYLITEVGNDMTLLSLEMEKLIAWCLERNEVTINDIDTVCTHQVNGKIFDMITAISEHRQKEALALYYDLLTLRESPFHIQSLLVRQYNNLLSVRDGLDKNYSYVTIADKTGIKDWLVKKMSYIAKKMPLLKIEEAIEACAKAEEDIKTGNMVDVLAIELLIISLSN
ncbi:MAG: DNA polymerase III subunit delta [Lachnospiraceae bacterium]|nr:DNA polymerase III subunit delta [Lachnospiraceae bacterium]